MGDRHPRMYFTFAIVGGDMSRLAWTESTTVGESADNHPPPFRIRADIPFPANWTLNSRRLHRLTSELQHNLGSHRATVECSEVSSHNIRDVHRQRTNKLTAWQVSG